MEDVVRQKNKRHVKGVVELSKHQVREAFQTLQKEIHEVPRGTLNAYAVNLRHEMNDPAIIVNTNAQCKALNEAIKSRLSSKATQGLGTYKSILKAFHLSKAQKKTVGSYEGASHIKFSRNVGRHFKRGETYQITKIDHERAELQLSRNGKTKRYRPARHGSGDSFTKVYTQSYVELHAGDRVKFSQADKKLGITNNDFGHVQKVTQDHITIKLDNKKQLTLPLDHPILDHIDHGWANTVYSFQGVTVTDNIAIMPAENNPLNTLESLYVGSSRHKENLAIITDDKDRLLRIISEKLDIASEKISYKEPSKEEIHQIENALTPFIKPVEHTPEKNEIAIEPNTYQMTL